MAQPVILHSLSQIEAYRQRIEANLSETMNALRESLKSEAPFAFFQKLKYDKLAKEPISGTPENLLEAVNQCQTYLVSLCGAEYLIQRHPGKTFLVNWGNVAGYDLEAADSSIVAECFAASSYRSNGKLHADLKRLEANQTSQEKYEFFFAPDFTQGQLQYYTRKYPHIHIVHFSQQELSPSMRP